MYLQRLHPSMQKTVKVIKDKSLSENNSQPDSNNNNKKLQKQKSLWTTNTINEEKNRIKEKVFLDMLIFINLLLNIMLNIYSFITYIDHYENICIHI